MVTPVSGSPIAFGLFYTRRVAASLTLPVQPRERAVRQDRVDISAAGRQQATESAAEPAGEPAAVQSGETGLSPGAPPERETTAGARSNLYVNATRRCDCTNRPISWLPVRTPKVPRAIPIRRALMASAML